MSIYLNPKKIIQVFIFIAVLLFIANAIAQILILFAGDDRFFGFVPMFHFDLEANAPTYFSSISLAFVAVLAAMIALAHKGRRYFWQWALMSAIFLFVSFDELVAVHEKLTRPLRDAFQLSGLLYYAWVIPYAVALVVLAIVYFRFFLDLPSRTRLLFMIAGVTFVSGAMGLEMLGGAIFDEQGTGRNLPYVILMTFEETLEMAGTILFIYALLKYMQENLPDLRLMLAANNQYQQRVGQILIPVTGDAQAPETDN